MSAQDNGGMMSKPRTSAKPEGDSLLERAARIYDFAAHAKPREVASPPDARPVLSDPAVLTPADPPSTVPLPLGEPVGLDVPAEYRAAAALGAPAAIDRMMLAQRGMIVPGAPIGPLAEEFRLVKRQLLVNRERIAAKDASDAALRAHTILICSAKPKDGKTFCAINLALSIAAERDTEVLLIDADFAKPDVMRQLGLDDGPGLLDALADPAIDLESLVVATDVPHLSVLPGGTRTVNDTELVASSRTRAVLSRLLDANPRRIIILDSPPALAASPASVLAMIVGQVMLVVRADRTPEGEVRDAVAQLDACEHISLVLNAVSFVPGGARFGSYYGQKGRS